MGYSEEQHNMTQRAYGEQGIRTGSGHPENQRGLQNFQERKRAERRNRESLEFISSCSSDTSSPSVSNSSSGEGLTVVFALVMLFCFFAAAGHMEQYTGSYNSAMVVVGMLFLGGALCLWLLWKLLMRVLVGIIDLLEVVWENRLGKICISIAVIMGAFYGANELYGDRGLQLLGQLLVAGVMIWGIYIALKWFCHTLVGKILLRTALIGGLIVIAWYVYAGHTP